MWRLRLLLVGSTASAANTVVWIMPLIGNVVAHVPDVLNWIFSMGEGERSFPIMDIVTSDFAEIDEWADLVGRGLAQPCADQRMMPNIVSQDSCPALDQISDVVGRLSRSLWPDEAEEAALVDWMLQLEWLDLILHGGADAARLLSRLAALADHRSERNHAHCDSFSNGRDDQYINDVRRGLDGVESLPLENNERKWGDFWHRRAQGMPFCPLGVATLLLVAGDVTAFAAGAVGGEHMVRLRRAVMFAQGIARHQQKQSEQQQFVGLDLTRTRWPIWRLVASIGVEFKWGRVGGMPAPVVSMPVRSPADPHLLLDNGDMYLSVVVQCRNDNYGGNMLLRLNRMLSTARLMLFEARIPAEIIVVEWNPPAGSLPLVDVVESTFGADIARAVPIRIIQVPPEVHMKIPHHKAHPIFEHTAENVAFRRARGRFILKTNMDNILSPDTVRFIQRRQLMEDAVYRATYLEYDVDQPETDGFTPAELLSWLFTRPDLLRNANQQSAELREKFPEDADVCEAGHVEGITSGSRAAVVRPFYWAGSGDFVLASRAFIFHVRGYPEVSQNWQTDDLIHCRLRAAGARQIVLQPPCVTVHQNHQRINRVRASTRWVITDSNFEETCRSPFRPLPTQISGGDDWGFPKHDFVEWVL
eukprot:TRINITY_DN41323_c0_g1_i1.p1 TRINITY_DN41323_c0_g1~~TRINITY_DN41323_c0_g1_i1.p1  ORF type:complete len:645 (-),score=101.20 TRINITY_DN41323_c0_g1_i1:431-2365(-)